MNANGVPSSSPGLPRRGCPGSPAETRTTLKGLRPSRVVPRRWHNPVGVGFVKPSNPGLVVGGVTRSSPDVTGHAATASPCAGASSDFSPLRRQLSPPRRRLSPWRTRLSPCRTELSPCRTRLSPSRTELSPSRTELSPSRTELSSGRKGLSPGRKGLSPGRKGLSPSPKSQLSALNQPL